MKAYSKYNLNITELRSGNSSVENFDGQLPSAFTRSQIKLEDIGLITDGSLHLDEQPYRFKNGLAVTKRRRETPNLFHAVIIFFFDYSVSLQDKVFILNKSFHEALRFLFTPAR